MKRIRLFIFVVQVCIFLLVNNSLYAQREASWIANGSSILYADPSNVKIGIGLQTPSSNLSINGDIDISGSRFHVGTNGKVGIGTNNPGSPLTVSTLSGNNEVLKLFSALSDFRVSVYSTYTQLQAWNNEASSPNNILLNPSGGSVGIGAVNPGSYKLAVNGSVRAKEVVVETGWSDFVFEDDYRLPPLEEVEQHIRQNKHLPDIPSAEEVSANGVSLGEMQAKLLQKIEELTLYMIELKKENKALKRRVESLATH